MYSFSHSELKLDLGFNFSIELRRPPPTVFPDQSPHLIPVWVYLLPHRGWSFTFFFYLCSFTTASARLLQVFNGSETQCCLRGSHQSTNLWANERPHAVIWGSSFSTTAALLLGERTHTRLPFTYVARVRSLKEASPGCKARRSLRRTYSNPCAHVCSHTNTHTHTHTQQTEVEDSIAPKTRVKQRHKWHPPVTIPIVAAFLCLIIYQMHLKKKGTYLIEQPLLICLC